LSNCTASASLTVARENNPHQKNNPGPRSFYGMIISFYSDEQRTS
jgi:hypothetical protein